MALEPVVLDTDTLSELSRGNAIVKARAAAYLVEFGRLTITAVTVFERLRGYRAAIRAGKPFERQLEAFEALVAIAWCCPSTRRPLGSRPTCGPPHRSVGAANLATF